MELFSPNPLKGGFSFMLRLFCRGTNKSLPTIGAPTFSSRGTNWIIHFDEKTKFILIFAYTWCPDFF
jgi:hypothetical protein